MQKTSSAVTQLIENDQRLQRVYTFHKKLSNGCFGYLFLVTNKYTNRRNALKVEVVKSESSVTLKKEFQLLKKLENTKGVPKVYNFGRTDKLMYLELELLVEDLSTGVERDGRMEVGKVCDVGYDMVRILEQVHARNIIHRDIKPQNMMRGKDDELYLIDFGISKEIVQNQPKYRVSFVGTPRYASVNAHKNKDQTPADDIESLLYNLIYLAKKNLPWINIRTVGNNKLDAILTVKLKKTKAELCKDLPKCFINIFQYLSKHKPQQKLDYDFLSNQFRQFRTKQVKTQIQTPIEHQSQPSPSSRSLQLKPRRASIQTNNFLVVPTNDVVVNGSQTTLDIPESQRVMASMLSMRSEQEPQEPQEQQENIDFRDMEENPGNEETVEKRIKALSRKVTNRLFYI